MMMMKMRTATVVSVGYCLQLHHHHFPRYPIAKSNILCFHRQVSNQSLLLIPPTPRPRHCGKSRMIYVGVFCSSSFLSSESAQHVVEDDIHALLQVILDLGRLPEARYVGESGGQYLRNTEVSLEELEYAQNAIGEIGEDNRGGIGGTLHRISAIRSRKGVVVGLTCRVGRSVRGYIDMVQDLLHFGESILFVGRPGVGKTTVLREISRVLSDELHKRVIGGVETVTLGDQKARSRNCKKSILERKAPPTFPFLIEMRERDYWITHRTERSVDLLLQGRKPLVEVRRRNNHFRVVIERWKPYE